MNKIPNGNWGFLLKNNFVRMTETIFILDHCQLFHGNIVGMYLIPMHQDLPIVMADQLKEKLNEPEPFAIKCYKEDLLQPIFLADNPRKDKSKQFTQQPWRKKRK